MKQLTLAVFAIATLVFAGAQSVDACGYGIQDPDVETFCSGDPNQAALALVNLVKRGPTAIKAIQRYKSRAMSQKMSYERFLVKLKAADPSLNMQPERIEQEILRVEKWLDWNQGRLQKANYLIFRFGGLALISQP